MKNKLEHIDKVFLNATADDGAEFSVNKGWKLMNLRLLLGEITSLNFVNVNWIYLIFSGILLLLFSSSLLYFGVDGKKEDIQNTSSSPEALHATKESNSSLSQYEVSPNIQNQTSPHITSIKKNFPVQNKHNTSSTVQNQNTSVTTQDEAKDFKHENQLETIEPRTVFSGIIAQDEVPTNVLTDIHLSPDVTVQNASIPEKQNDSSQNFLLGFNAGNVFLLNEAGSKEDIQKPILFVGLNLRYCRPHFYIETAVEFSCYESVLNSSYRYDSLLGTITSSGYEIVETVNEDGETVLERQFHSELTPIYDTLSSKDLVRIESKSTVLYIPLRVGTQLFLRNNFYTNVFAGVVFKLLIGEKQSLPEFGTENRKIIAYETNPVISYEPDFYFQAGLLFGYNISKSFSLEIQSSYNHILGGNSNTLQNSESNIKAGIGLNFKF